MRLIVVTALTLLPMWSALAAPTWQTITSEPGKRIELDRTSIKREDGGKVTATGRISFDRDIPDARSGTGYRIIEATARYDCNSRNGATVKRVYKKNESEVLREEELKSAELPVRTGTLDEKVLREVCRPGKESLKGIAEKANEAAGQLKQANESLVKAELAKSGAGALPVKVAEKPGQAMLLAKAEEQRPSTGIDTRAPMQRLAKKVKSDPRPYPVDPAREHASLQWSYEGEGAPENWAKLDPKNILCSTGQRQSPIDIRDGIRVDLEPIKFDYKPSYFRIVDTGSTVQVAVGEGSITITGKTYELVEFHFHKPAEERINGRGFDMVAHLVHRAPDGKMAIVAVLLEKGGENPFIQTLWNNLPLERNMEVSPPSAPIDLNALLPASRNYYAYMGSLTTPPCTEGVLWLVMRQPMQVSTEQIGIFSRLYKNNARPVQAAWGRLIKEGR